MKITTKYNGVIDLYLYQEYCIKSIFKILPLMEEGKEWKKYLRGFLLELSGIENLTMEVNFISLIGRLEGLLLLDPDPNNDEDKDFFKKIIFDSIDLVKKMEL